MRTRTVTIEVRAVIRALEKEQKGSWGQESIYIVYIDGGKIWRGRQNKNVWRTSGTGRGCKKTVKGSEMTQVVLHSVEMTREKDKQ